MMLQPMDFVVAGVQKAGTSTMFEYLRLHPELAAPRVKELHFFDDETIDWTTPAYEHLHANFADSSSGKRFEATPIYTFWPPSLERIRCYNPEIRLVVLFRDPIDRAFSHWCMEYARGGDTIAFADAIRHGRQRLSEGALDNARRVYSYVERGFYVEQVERLLATFPRCNCHFIDFNEFVNDTRGVLDALASFLGISSFPGSPAIKENERPGVDFPSVLTSADIEYLAELYRPELARFSSLTGIDTERWQTSWETRATT